MNRIYLTISATALFVVGVLYWFFEHKKPVLQKQNRSGVVIKD